MNDMDDKLIQALNDAFEKGWCAAAQWASRDDLRHDTGSVAYSGQRDAILAGKASGLRSAILADAAKDVEPVAWGIFANNGNIRFWACDKASADSQAAKTGGDVEGLCLASTLAAAQALNAELVARVEGLEKDAARLDFVCSSPNRMVERESGLWRVYEDVAPTDHPTAVWQGMSTRWHVSPREAIDAAIAARNGT